MIGGGAAGLSGALVLGRARQDVLLLDAGKQSNRAAHAIGGLLAQEGTSPDALYAAAHAQLGQYPSVTVKRDEVVGLDRDGDGTLTARLAGGDSARGRRVLLATSRGSRSAGATPSSTARSATGGRCATARWPCSAMGRAP